MLGLTDGRTVGGGVVVYFGLDVGEVYGGGGVGRTKICFKLSQGAALTLMYVSHLNPVFVVLVFDGFHIWIGGVVER